MTLGSSASTCRPAEAGELTADELYVALENLRNVPWMTSEPLQRNDLGFDRWLRRDEANIDMDAVDDFLDVRSTAAWTSNLVGRDIADGTSARYQRAVSKFLPYMVWLGQDIDQPSPQAVALYFGHMMRRGKLGRNLGSGIAPTDGDALSYSTLVGARSAISHHYRNLGGDDPTNSDFITRLFKAYSRNYPRNVKRADPLMLSDLIAVTEFLHTEPTVEARDRAVVALLADPSVPLTGPEAERLRSWDQIEWPTSDDGPLVIRGVGSADRTIERGRTLDTCPVLAMKAWHDARNGRNPVFPGHRDRPLSRPGLLKIVERRAAQADAHCVQKRGLPRIPDARTRRRVLRLVTDRAGRLSRAQSLALITLGVFVQARRSELAALTWPEVKQTETGLLVTYRRSKTDQRGVGADVHATAKPGKPYCPVDALLQWRQVLEAALGQPVSQDSPIFRNPQRLNEPLQPDGFNQAVKRATTDAGLIGNYSAHSLRATIPTLAAMANLNRERVAIHGRRASVAGLRDYVRVSDSLTADITAHLL